MTRSFLLKIAVVLLGAGALLAVGIPLGLYWLGLSNIEGRPEPPMQTSNVIADSAQLQRDLRTQKPVVIDAPNPWTFFVGAIQVDPKFSSEHARSLRAVGMIVNHYNSARGHEITVAKRPFTACGALDWLR
jgi:hypothetical protein